MLLLLKPLAAAKIHLAVYGNNPAAHLDLRRHQCLILVSIMYTYIYIYIYDTYIISE